LFPKTSGVGDEVGVVGEVGGDVGSMTGSEYSRTAAAKLRAGELEG